MKTIKSTGNQIWVLFYQWGDSESTWWGAYDSLEALLFDFDYAYSEIAYNSTDDLTDEEIARARAELKAEAKTENTDLGLYMSISPMVVYKLDRYEPLPKRKR